VSTHADFHALVHSVTWFDHGGTEHLAVVLNETVQLITTAGAHVATFQSPKVTNVVFTQGHNYQHCHDYFANGGLFRPSQAVYMNGNLYIINGFAGDANCFVLRVHYDGATWKYDGCGGGGSGSGDGDPGNLLGARGLLARDDKVIIANRLHHRLEYFDKDLKFPTFVRMPLLDNGSRDQPEDVYYGWYWNPDDEKKQGISVSTFDHDGDKACGLYRIIAGEDVQWYYSGLEAHVPPYEIVQPVYIEDEPHDTVGGNPNESVPLRKVPGPEHPP